MNAAIVGRLLSSCRPTIRGPAIQVGRAAISSYLEVLINNCRCSYMAGLGVTLNGTDVSALADQNPPTGFHVTQVAGALQPLWVAKRQNFQPCIEFTAANTDRLFRAQNLFGAGPYTVIIFFKERNAGGTWVFGSQFDVADGMAIQPTNATHFGVADHNFTDLGRVVAGLGVRQVSTALVEAIHNGRPLTIANPTLGTLNNSGSAVISIGAINTGAGPIGHSDLDFYEAHCYTRALSNAEWRHISARGAARLALEWG